MILLIDSARQDTAIHHKRVTGDEAGAVRGQEYGSANEFMQLPEALHRCAQQQKLPASEPSDFKSALYLGNGAGHD